MQEEAMTKEAFVRRYLRQAIVSGALAPGTRIHQQQLADELGMSATPVREALRGLVMEGWLSSSPHVGVSVASINSEGLDEIYRIRALLEGFLAAEAARKMTQEVLDRIRPLNEEFVRATEDGDFIRARALNFALHNVVWETAGCPVTLGIVNGLWAKFPWNTLGIVPGRDRRTFEEHGELIEALEKRDSERARAALIGHIESGRIDYERLISEKLVGDADNSRKWSEEMV